MNGLYAELLWVGLLATLAGPLVPGVVAYIMSLNRTPVLAGAAFTLGAALVAVLFSVVAILILSTTTTSGKGQYIIYTVLGLVFLGFGLKAWASRPPEGEDPVSLPDTF